MRGRGLCATKRAPHRHVEAVRQGLNQLQAAAEAAPTHNNALLRTLPGCFQSAAVVVVGFSCAAEDLGFAHAAQPWSVARALAFRSAATRNRSVWALGKLVEGEDSYLRASKFRSKLVLRSLPCRTEAAAAAESGAVSGAKSEVKRQRRTADSKAAAPPAAGSSASGGGGPRIPRESRCSCSSSRNKS